MTGRPPAVQAALDQLGAAFEALDPWARLPLHQQTLAAAHREDVQPQERPIWLALHRLAGDATTERLDRLVSALEVVGQGSRWALRETARRAAVADEPRRLVWAALAQLVDTLGA